MVRFSRPSELKEAGPYRGDLTRDPAANGRTLMNVEVSIE